MKTLRPHGYKAVNRLLTRDRLLPKVSPAKMSLKGVVRYLPPKSDIGIQDLQFSIQREFVILRKARWWLSGTNWGGSHRNGFLGSFQRGVLYLVVEPRELRNKKSGSLGSRIR